VSFFFRDWAMLDALRNNEQLTGTESDIALSHLYGDAPFENEKEIVSLVVLVPDERPFNFDDHQVVPVELANRSWLEVLGKQRQLLGQVDAVHEFEVRELHVFRDDTIAEAEKTYLLRMWWVLVTPNV
jgi:hypothetical protein